MRVAAVACVLALGACFSKPTFSQRDAGPGDGGGGGDGLDALDAPIDSLEPLHLALQKISAGGRHVCAIGNDTRLWCWGDNDHGQLGDSSDTATGSPVLASTVNGMGWSDVAAGTDHTCGIFNGTAYCWGLNEDGQSKPSMPGGDSFMQPITLSGTPSKVFAGRYESCAILVNGEAYCWGALDVGATGATTRSMPTQLRIDSVTTFTSIALADDHGCAIATDERLFCWGDDTHNELGHDIPIGSDQAFASPVETNASSSMSQRFKSVDVANDVTCAVTTTTNDLHCWGASTEGHLLSGADHALFHAVETLLDWDSVAIDIQHACARTMAGVVHCWGKDADGALGKGDFAQQVSTVGGPINVNGLTSGHTRLVAGEHFTCVINQNANAYCWGANRSGELGNREIATKDLPSRVRLPQLGASDLIRDIVTGFEFTCALVGAQTGAVTPYCWGRNSEKQVDTTAATLAEPIPKIAIASTFTQISAGERHVCGLPQGGASLTCWGENVSQQLGRMGPAGVGNPIPMPGTNMPWTYVAAGSQGSCAISDGNLSCWGNIPGGANGQPVTAFGRGTGWTWKSLSIGSGFAVGVADPMPAVPGKVYLAAFGPNCASGIGMSGTTAPTAAITIRKGIQSPTDDYSVLVVAAAQHNGGHTCIHYQTVESSTPRVSCFGQNSSGQVNQTETTCSGGTATHALPLWRTAVTGAQSISTASLHSCALSGTNQLYCWGGNSNHELGAVQTTGNPSQINTGPWSGVSTGFAHTCVVDDPHKAVYCWGENRHGQLGDGTRFRPSPVAAGLVLP